MVGLDAVEYVGNHGLESWTLGERHTDPRAAEYAPIIRQLVEDVHRRLKIPGLVVEDKGTTASLHYRLAPSTVRAREEILAHLAATPVADAMRITEGKLVVEVRPPVEVDKGTALARLVREHRLNSVVFIGDDVTDVDAFRAIHALSEAGVCQGLALGVVGQDVHPLVLNEADLLLNGVADVEALLEGLV